MAHKQWKTWMKIAFIPLAILSTCIADFTKECQRPCDCKWQSGNKAAICTNSSLKSIPANLSSDIQILDLSNNNLHSLHQEAFKRVGLSNLKKLFLKECNIEVINKAAFATLAIMIELDLSKNKIRTLHPDTFKGTEKLRLINLSFNSIDKLEDGLFRNLKYLQKVEVSNNLILRIGTKTFVNLPQLKILRFDGNKLSHMKPETLMSLRNLSGLDLHNNPWRCDCNMQSFRDWVMSHNLYTPPTACSEPPAIRDKLWNELNSSNFACRPTILEPLPDATLRSYDENVTLTCKIVGNPQPEVVWRFNGRTIETKAFGEIRYVLTENTMDLIRWVNLTILHARYSDRGNYTCIAENPGGRDEKTLMLVLSKFGGAGMIAGMDTDSFAILIGCMTSVIFIFGSVMAVCYFTNQNRGLKRLIKTDTRSSNGEALIEGSMPSEMEKGFKLEVNPVTKPPRKYEAPPSITSEATEMSELNRTLLDNESVLASTEDTSRLEVELPKISQETLLIDRLTQDHQAYPPDLLSFPLRGTMSPTSGTSSLEKPLTDSPMRSPNCPPMFRFQNPYQPGSPKGYVTLPRRPRQDKPYSVGPNDFNMKLFTANHFNFNQSEMDLGYSKLGYPFNGSEEFEPAPSPAPGTPHANIPRSSISSPNIHNQLLSLQAMTSRIPRSEQRPLKVMFTENESLLRNPIRDLRAGYSVNVVSGTIRTRARTAPKPPPKPRKKAPCDLKEQFLLNSENATQV